MFLTSLPYGQSVIIVFNEQRIWYIVSSFCNASTNCQAVSDNYITVFTDSDRWKVLGNYILIYIIVIFIESQYLMVGTTYTVYSKTSGTITLQKEKRV